MVFGYLVGDAVQLTEELLAGFRCTAEAERTLAERALAGDGRKRGQRMHLGAEDSPLSVAFAVREREEARRKALAGARMGTWRCNQRERTWRGDAAFLDLYGIRTADELLPLEQLFRWVSPDVGAQLEDVLMGERAAGEEFVKELHFTSGLLAGCWHRWKGQADPVEPWLITGACFDITEEAHTLQALRESEARFRALIVASSDVVCRMSPDWSEMLLLVGRNFIPDTMEPSRSWLQRYIHPDDQAHVSRVIEQAITTKSKFELEHRVLRVDGSLGWAFSRAMPVLDAAGEIVEWLGTASDVGARRETELELAADWDALQRTHAVSTKGVKATELQHPLQELLDTAVRILRADKGILQLLEDDTLRIVTQHGHEPPFLEVFAVMARDASISGEALRCRQSVTVEDVERHPLFADPVTQDVLRAAAVRAVQSTPLLTRSGRPLGVLTAHWSKSPSVNDKERWRMELLARQVAALIERQQLEAALRQSEERFRVALKGSPAVVYSLDRDLRYTWVYNPLSEFGSNQLVGKCVEEVWGELWRAEDVATLKAIKQKAMADGLARRDEIVLHRRGDDAHAHALALDITTEPLRDGNGTLTGVTCVAVELTDQKRAQELLRAKRFNERLIDTANVAIMGLDARGCTTLFNMTAEKITGYASSELAHRNWFEVLVPRERYADVWAELSHHAANRMPDTFETPILTKAGEERIMGWRNSAISVGDGTVITISFGIDLTEQRRAEHYLMHAQKMESIGTLAGGIAHDFNNLLNGIMGGLGFFELSQAESAERLTEIEDMKALVRRGADLCRQLLGFACRGKCLPKPLDVARVVEETAYTFWRTRNDITILHEFAEGLPPVLMDQSQLEQTLINLFLNAAHAMPAGGRLLLHAEEATITGEHREAPGVVPGHFVRLVVADTGVGMDSATKSRVFEPFFTTGQWEGAGLGLASAYGIVKNHGGTISVDSEPGKGSAFTLLLPVAEVRPQETTLSPSARAQQGGGLILLVDDDARLLGLWERALRRSGYEVLTAPNGRGAVELARLHKDELKLAILDLVMPEMSGAEAFDAIRKIAPELKVLLASGRSDEGEVRKLLDRGCSGFIAKPFDLATLTTKLQSLM